MAELCIESGDVLAAAADGIILPIDGTIVPRPEQLQRILGNVGRQFARRFPDAELLEQIEAQLDLPLPLGQAAAVTLEAGPFTCAILASTLHHVDLLDAAAKRALVRTSCCRA